MTFDLRPASSAKLNGPSIPSVGRDGGVGSVPDAIEAAPRAAGSHGADAFSGPARNVLREAAAPTRFGGAESLEADLAQALAELSALKRQVFPQPSGLDVAKQTLGAVRANLESLVGTYRQREQGLLASLETADSQASAQMIQVQIVQLRRTKTQFEAMLAQLSDFQVPVGLNPRALARLSAALQDVQGVVRGLAGGDASALPAQRVEFERAMAQLRAPERDLSRDILSNAQFALLMDASRMLASLHNRLNQLSREAHGSSGRRMPADAQMHQLTQRYHDFARLFDALLDFQPKKGLSARPRQEAASALSQLHRELQRSIKSQAPLPESLLDGLRRWQAP